MERDGSSGTNFAAIAASGATSIAATSTSGATSIAATATSGWCDQFWQELHKIIESEGARWYVTNYL